MLLLGSLPGQRSLAAGEYYAHPQNQFWKLISAAIGKDIQPLCYPDRLATLLDHRIGLWDAVAEACRPGSLDSALRDIAANDLTAVVARMPDLRLIAFNGQKAGQIGRRRLGSWPAAKTLALPSSSPAFTKPVADKAAIWRAALRTALVGRKLP